jgi:hypothetical protein
MGTLLATARCSLLAPSDAELRGSGGPGDAGSDAADDAGDGSVIAYNDLTAASAWSTFDLRSAFSAAHDFAGGAFDGRYVYLAPSAGGVVARYDIQAPLTQASSWFVFDAGALDPKIKGYGGAVFDGRYVYFVPYGGCCDVHGVVTRYDTRGEFGDTAGWTTFDTTSVNPGAEGFVGATFDGRYVYFAPHRNQFANSDGIVTRFDTTADFHTKTSWETYDVAPLSSGAGAGGFQGAVFDGQYVYFVQNQNAGTPAGFVARFSARSTFGAAGSWSFVDLDGLAAGAKSFFGAAFDGRYVYAVPSHPGAPSILARLDTRGSFSASWMTVDTTAIGAQLSGFAGAAFDGRYVYLVPHDNGAPDGVVARLDTTAADFKTAAAWSTFDTTRVNAAAKGFTGAIFDGRYLYFVPSAGGVVARFEAKTGGGLPNLPAFHGSFL